MAVQIDENETGAFIADLGIGATGLVPEDPRFEIRLETNSNNISTYKLYLKPGESLDYETEALVSVNLLIGPFVSHTISIEVQDGRDMTLRGLHETTSFVPQGGSPQTQTAVTALDDGGYVVVWTTNSGEILAQRFDADGTAVGDQIEVDTTTPNPIDPSVTVLQSGDFVVSWQSRDASSGETDVFARRFEADGGAAGDTIALSFEPAEDQYDPDLAGLVTALDNGGFVVTWISDHESPGTFNLYSVRFDQDGNRLDGTESQVSAGTARNPDIAALADGGYVISWEGADGSIFSRSYASTGQPGSAAIEHAGGSAFEPSVTTLPDGSYIVAWSTYTSARAQIVGSDGVSTGDVLTLMSRATDSRVGSGEVSLITLSDGGFAAVVRAGDGSFLTRYFDADGTPRGPAIAVGEANNNDDNPAVTVLADGSVVISDRGVDSIDLTRVGVPENVAGRVIGALTAIDETDTGVTYSVSDDRFEVINGQLKLKDGVSLDYETETEVSVTVTATETDGDVYSETFVLPILDGNDLKDAVFAGILEDSASSGGSDNANGVTITDDQLALVVDRVLEGSTTSASPMEARYQAAIQAETGFSNLPTTAEVQAIIDAENADLSRLFSGSNSNRSDFNEAYVGDWDVSSVTNMSMMFRYADEFNQAIGDWDVGSVTNMTWMFGYADDFNQAIGDWDVSSVSSMRFMFYGASDFNQAIGEWDVSSVTNMSGMLRNSTDFDQDIGGWDISSLQTASSMLNDSGMSQANFDNLLSGWSTLDTSAGETAIQSGVSLGASGLTYTDATSLNHLKQVYGWTTTGASLTTDPTVSELSNQAENFLIAPINLPGVDPTSYTVHALDGDDTIQTANGDDILVGGAGNDTLTGGSGADIFVYKFSNAGDDTITDFAVGEDGIDVGQLIIGYEDDVSNLSDFVSIEAGANNDAKLVIDADGLGSNTDEVTITLTGVDHTNISVDDIMDGELVLSLINQNPQVGTALQNQSSDEDTAVSFTLPTDAFTDADGDTLTMTATMADGSALPTWLTFTASSGTFSGTPPQDYNGTLSIKVSASDGQTGSTPATQTFSLTISPVNDGPAGYVTIDGTVAEGQTLSANTTMLSDPDGLGTLAHQWQASTDGVQWTDIAGAASASYTPSAAQASQMLRVVVSYTDNGGTSESLTSALAGLSTAQIAVLVEILEDSASSGGANNANGVAVTENQLALVVDRLLTGNESPMLWRYQQAIQAETGFSSPPTPAEIQAIIDAENADLSGLFYFASGRGVQDTSYLVGWDVSLVTDMSYMFNSSDPIFHQAIGIWNVGSVTNMSHMFTASDFDEAIGEWDVSSVTNMSWMFGYATNFNQAIGDWDVSSVTNMSWMFSRARDFNQAIGDWDVGSVTDMSSMFLNAVDFNQDISDWDVSSLEDASYMLNNSGMSTENFNNLMEGWSTDSSGVDDDGVDDIPFNITLGAVGLTYTNQEAYVRLVTEYGWTISGAISLATNDPGSISDILQEILEDSTSSGGSGNANAVAVTDDQLALIAERVLAGSATSASPMEARYQAAIQAETGFSNPPTAAEVQAIIDAQNADLSNLFYSVGFSDFNEAYVIDWDVSSVTNMSSIFSRAKDFNQNIGDWDVSSVTNMSRMFSNAWEFNQAIGDWDVSSVTDMSYMFWNAEAFNEVIGDWDVSSVTDMRYMFYGADNFNQDIGNWNVSSVADMSFMFYAQNDFNQDIGNWDVSSVADMEWMFGHSDDFNQAIDGWDVSSVTNMRFMFYDAEAFNQDISNWDISSLQGAHGMLSHSGMSTANFDFLLEGWSTDSSGNDSDGIDDIPLNLTLGAHGLTYTNQEAYDRLVNDYGWTIEGASFDTAAESVLQEVLEDSVSSGGSSNSNGVAVTDDQLTLVAERVLAGSDIMEARYQAAIQAETGFSNLPTTAELQAIIDAENADLSGLFAGVDSSNRSDFNGGYIVDWDVSSVASMARMFANTELFNQDIGAWDVSSVTDMRGMFGNTQVFNQNIGAWDVSSVTDMGVMFANAGKFDGDISEWDVSSVTKMDRMFDNASDFDQNIGDWEVSSVTNMYGMFAYADSFDQNIGDWDISSLQNAGDMFSFSGMSTTNFDKLLAGWATLDTSAGETAIQTGVSLGAHGLSYTDATSLNHLEQVYGWTITGAASSGANVLSNQADVLEVEPSFPRDGYVQPDSTIHGLDGNDTIRTANGDDILVGGAGNDILTGGNGADTFVYKFSNAGNDRITDFVAAEDVIDLSQLIIGYRDGVSNLSDYIWVEESSDGKVTLVIDHDGSGADTDLVRATLESIDYSTIDPATYVQNLVTGGQVVLDDYAFI